MSFLSSIIIFGWIPFSIYLFTALKAHRAVLVIIIGGNLFLPTISYSFPGIPDFTKGTAIALGLVLGGYLSGKRHDYSFRRTAIDLPMILWCLCPMATSYINDLGLYDGLSSSFKHIINWGIPYFAGKVYFKSKESIKDACLGIIIGGLIYAPLCLYEVRMSPQLSNIVYGFFPHSWIQHNRGGNYRPIVFMQHGLMVALWMAATSTVAYSFWRSKIIQSIHGVPISIVFFLLSITCILCKSVNGIFALTIGCCLNKRKRTTLLLISAIPIYLGLSMANIITSDDVKKVATLLVNKERVDSLSYRLHAEELYFQKALERPLLGWGGYGRGNPLDPKTGQPLRIAIDAFWLIAMRGYGFLGLTVSFFAMLLGPSIAIRSAMQQKHLFDYKETCLYLTALSLIVILFMIDCLVNSMLNSTYIFLAGVLLNSKIVLSDKQTYSHNIAITGNQEPACTTQF